MKVNLAAMRTHRGLTQRELADKVGVSNVTIVNWEKYRTSPDAIKMMKICEALDCAPDDLIFFARDLTKSKIEPS